MAIENNIQYLVTQEVLKKMNEALLSLSVDNKEKHALLKKAQIDAINSVIDELNHSVKEYENIINNNIPDLINPLQTDMVLGLIKLERAAQDKKWGEQNHSDEKWMLIEAEEIGETAKEILENNPEKQFVEMVQAAAVLTSWIESFLRRNPQLNRKSK